MKAILFFAFVCLLGLSQALRWRVNDANGDQVIRGIRILQNNADTISVVAFQVNENNRRQRDAIQFRFTTNIVPRFAVRYFERDGDSAEFAAGRIGLRKIVEYVENSTADGFQPGQDLLVQSYYLWQQNWTPFEVVRDQSNGADLTRVCTGTDDGVVRLCVFITNLIDNLQVNGSSFTIDPNAVSHTFEINNFPFQRSDSRLALKTQVDTRTRAAEISTTDPTALEAGEDAIDMSDEGSVFRPAFSWKTTVDVTGTGCSATAPVVRSEILLNELAGDIDLVNPRTEDSLDVTFNLVRRIVYHSFLTDCAQPTRIFWDPDFGVIDSGVGALVPSLMFIFVLIALFL